MGDYDKFMEVYEMKKAQREAAYNRQQKEIAELEDFVARNKARVATRNMAMSRQKKLDKMDIIEKAVEKPKPEFNFQEARTPGRYIIQTKGLVIGYDEPLSRPLDFTMERGEKVVLFGANGIGKTTLLKSILGLVPALSGLEFILSLDTLSRRWLRATEIPALRKSGRNFRDIPSIRCVRRLQSADSRRSISRVRCRF